MEIDLELPSHEQRLDNGSNIDDDDTGNLDGMDVQDSEVDVQTGNDNVIEFCGPNANSSVTGRLELFAEADGVHEVSVREPRLGLEFGSKEAAYYFYREYARSMGFGITIKASRRSKKSGKFIDVKIACSRFGSKRELSAPVNPRSCLKTDCKAGMHMKRKEDEKWVICNFVKEHNHEICPDDFYIGIRGKTKQAVALAHQKKGLQLALEEEDLKIMLEHFMAMQDESPGFFYAIDLDCEKHIRNVLWVDAKAKNDYGSFSDVVLFDTFYFRNKFKIPFAPFVGVNHHCQYILLGCALIGEESASTFSWLFHTWLKAVGGQAPKVIITDEDKLLSETVVEVFPSIRYCFCLWNVLSKIPEKLLFSMNQYDDFMKSFINCIHSSWTDEQFERRWSEMVSKFELSDNEWFHSLFKDRKKWAPHYFRGICLAGMSAHERSGSIASHFDKYMDSEATFKDFFKLYMKFSQDQYDVEAKADLESQSKQPVLRSLSAFEKQLSVIYTDTAFKKFQAEVLGVVSCQLRKEREDGTTVIFCIEDFEKRQTFFVAWNRGLLDVCCSCYLFEYWGFLCKHTILVLQNSGVSSIPCQYILSRWSKNGNTRVNRNERYASVHNRLARFDDLCRHFVKFGEMASSSEEAYNTMFKLLEETLKRCVNVNSSAKFVSEPNKSVARAFVCKGGEDPLDSTSRSSKQRKTHKRRKAYSGAEDTDNRSQVVYQGTANDRFVSMPEQMSSRVHNLENCYIPQPDMGDPELGCRAASLSGYNSSQQTIQGFSSVPPIQDSYYGTQPTTQVMGNLHSFGGRMSQYDTQPGIHAAIQGQVSFRETTIGSCFNIGETLRDMAMDSSQFESSGSRHSSGR